MVGLTLSLNVPSGNPYDSLTLLGPRGSGLLPYVLPEMEKRAQRAIDERMKAKGAIRYTQT